MSALARVLRAAPAAARVLVPRSAVARVLVPTIAPVARRSFADAPAGAGAPPVDDHRAPSSGNGGGYRNLGTSIYVGNLPFAARPDELSALFEKYGTVYRSRILFDQTTGRSRGFGYVDMEPSAAQKAMEGLNGFTFLGRELRVNEATSRRRSDVATDARGNGNFSNRTQ